MAMPKATALFSKIKDNLHNLGQKPVLEMLEMYYLAKDKATPVWIITLVAGALAYFILPFDAVADFLPFGFVDDLAILAAAYKKTTQYITEEQRAKALARYQQWFNKA